MRFATSRFEISRYFSYPLFSFFFFARVIFVCPFNKKTAHTKKGIHFDDFPKILCDHSTIVSFWGGQDSAFALLLFLSRKGEGGSKEAGSAVWLLLLPFRCCCWMQWCARSFRRYFTLGAEHSRCPCSGNATATAGLYRTISQWMGGVAKPRKQLFGPESSSDAPAAAGSWSGNADVIYTPTYHDRTAFFFGRTKKCCLCQCFVTDAGLHMATLQHECGEMLLALLSTPFEAKGESGVEEYIGRWAPTLCECDDFHRIRRLSAGKTVSQRIVTLRQCLLALREVGIFKIALPASGALGGLEFERLECLGDHAWGTNISRRVKVLFPQLFRRAVAPGPTATVKNGVAPAPDQMAKLAASQGVLREAMESNYNLSIAFDALDLEKLLPQSWEIKSEKKKADILEATLGELHLAHWALEPRHGAVAFSDVLGECTGDVVGVVEHTMNELFDLIALVMLYHYAEMVVPLLPQLMVETRHVHSSLAVLDEHATKPPSVSRRAVRLLPPLRRLSPTRLPAADTCVPRSDAHAIAGCKALSKLSMSSVRQAPLAMRPTLAMSASQCDAASQCAGSGPRGTMMVPVPHSLRQSK